MRPGARLIKARRHPSPSAFNLAFLSIAFRNCIDFDFTWNSCSRRARLRRASREHSSEHGGLFVSRFFASFGYRFLCALFSAPRRASSLFYRRFSYAYKRGTFSFLRSSHLSLIKFPVFFHSPREEQVIYCRSFDSTRRLSIDLNEGFSNVAIRSVTVATFHLGFFSIIIP